MAQKLEILLQAKNLTGQAFKAVEGHLSKLKGSTNSSSTAAKKQTNALRDLAKQTLLLGGGLYALRRGVDLVTSSLEAQAKQEAAVNSLNLALSNQGNLSESTSRSLQEYASALQNVTTFGDETILQAQGLLASFGMNEEQIKQTTVAALDFASATGRDLTSAVNLMGKAFVGETGELSRYGIIIDKNIPKSEKFSAVMGQMTTRFGGQAQAATKTYAGQMAQLGNAFGDAKESLGRFVGEVVNMGDASGSGIAFAKTLQEFFGVTLVKALAEARAWFSDFIGTVLEGFAILGEQLEKIPFIGKKIAGEWTATLHMMSSDMQEHAIKLRQQGEAAAKSSGQFQQYTNATAHAAAGVETLGEKSAKADGEVWKLGAAVMSLPGAVDMTTTALGEMVETLGSELPEAIDHTKDVFGDLSEEIADNGKDTEDATKATSAWAGALKGASLIAGLFGGSAEQMVQIIGNIGDEFKNATTKAEKFSAIASGIGQIGSQIGGKTGGALQGAAGGAQIGMIAGPWGAAVGAVVGGIAGLIKGSQAAVIATNDVRDAFFETQGGFEAFAAAMAQVSDEEWAKKLFDAKTVEEFNALVKEAEGLLNTQSAAQEALSAAVQKYGFTIEELGPKWQQQELDKMAGSLLKDYELLVASGIDVNTVISKMGPNFQEYVDTALAAGQALPESMRPAIEEMIRMGLLTNASGEAFASVEEAGITFTESLSEGLSSLIDQIKDLVAALTGVPRDIKVNTSYTHTGQPPGKPGGYPPGGGEYPPAANGAVVLPFRPRAAADGALIHARPGGELVNMGEGGQAELAVPVKALLDQMTSTAVAAAGGGGGGSQRIVIEVDGRALADVIMRRNRSGQLSVRESSVRRY